jgi:hypothetical protein
VWQLMVAISLQQGCPGFSALIQAGKNCFTSAQLTFRLLVLKVFAESVAFLHTTEETRTMKKISLMIAVLALVASGPVFSEVDIISLHSSVGHMVQTTLLGVNPLLLLAGVLLFAGTIVYRLKRAK